MGADRSTRARRVRVHAFAKINLTLRVLGLRKDGYHNLETAFQSLALHDTLTFTSRPGPFVIECNDPLVPVDVSNLVWRAAERLWRGTGHRAPIDGVAVKIQKAIPMQAGLGGGSSNAAATLRALNALWRLKVSAERLRRMASELGADVPFFLLGGTALGVRRGDRLTPQRDAPARYVVLVLPDFGVSTPAAYRWWDEGNYARPQKNDSRPLFQNDLQAPVVAHHPEIGEIVQTLERLGASRAAMSGSGSAVFGLFRSAKTAQNAARALAWRTMVTRTVPRRDYRQRARVLAA